MAKLTINTTQNIKIDFKNSSLGERILACLLDFIFKALYAIIVWYVVVALKLHTRFEDNWSQGAFILICMSPVIFYSFIFESILQGCTPGKKILGIKVIKIDGYQASVVDYFTRWIMRIIDLGISGALIGVIAMIFSEKNQRLGDMLAGTAVISTKGKVALSATIFQEVEQEYKPVYPQVLTLSDNDVRIIKEALQNFRHSRDYVLLNKLSDKIQKVMGVQKQGSSELEFIEVVLKDYNYLTDRI